MVTNTATPPATAPGEGERRAQRGYSRQYEAAAAAIYATLSRGELEWVGLADRAAGIADDVVLGLSDRVVGHQFKTSRFPVQFRLQTLLMGADGLLVPLVEAWRALRLSNPGKVVEVLLVTNDYPSTTDNLSEEEKSHSAAFLAEFNESPRRSLAQWRASTWRPLIDALITASGLDELEFDQFLKALKIISGPAADFVQFHRLSPEEARLAGEISSFLPRLVSDPRDKDRWTRDELLNELGWRDDTVSHHIHQFPIGAYVQRNEKTEAALRDAIQNNISGYVSLVGPPGAGKSTLLQVSLESAQDMFLIRYLAFVPGVAQGVGRGEADDFFDDISVQLKRTGLHGLRYRNESLHERREQFNALLREAGERFSSKGVRTIIVIDGLDHVPREENPQRSFLAELPLPGAVPDGVLFVLGTQRVNLNDIKPAVQDQASAAGRSIDVAPLSREAVYHMASLLGLDSSVDRGSIFDASLGHPLATRYLIEALRDADEPARNKILAGAMAFEGDIEAVYESAWRGIRDDDQARIVLDYLARAEGAMPLEVLIKSVPEAAVERALQATRHLLAEEGHGWRVFHNSFRLFILGKPKLRLGKPDLAYGRRLYRELAELARAAEHDSPQHWLELRYLARAEEHAAVLALATPARFRQQLADKRSFAELNSDLRLAFKSARHQYNPLKVFQLLLIQDEISRRWSAYEDASHIVEALLHIGDIDGAVAFVEQVPAKGYVVVDALLEAGEIARAQSLFERLEPLQQLLSGTSPGSSLEVSELQDWARRVIHFRDTDQILQAIKRLSIAARLPGMETDQADIEELAAELRLEAALAIVRAQEHVDIAEVARSYGIDADEKAALMIGAGIAAAQRSDFDVALERIREAVGEESFSLVANAWRRTAALIAAKSGDIELAGTIFDGLRVPALADLDKVTDFDAPEYVARAVLEHAELASMLGRQAAVVPAPDRQALKPLQYHSEAIGRLLGRARLDSSLLLAGEVARAARAALTYLDRLQPADGEHYAVHQAAVATPVLGRALIQAAALCGESEFAATIAEFDQFFVRREGGIGGHSGLRRQIAIEVYRCAGDADEASRRLETMVEDLLESTPSQQINELASLASTFAQVGNVARARGILLRLPNESLGYALAPKKDPQYATWREIFERANGIDSAGRSGRVATLLRQVNGMVKTEGYSAACRLAVPLIKEAAMCDAQTGWSAAQVLVEHSMVGWARAVDALLCGMIKRRPDITLAAAVTWCELSLPYYIEPYFSESELGSFIEFAVAAASLSEVVAVVEVLLFAIEAESQVHERADLLDRLCGAARARGVWSQAMESSRLRWRSEAPPPRRSDTPMRYEDVYLLSDLKEMLEKESASREPGYEAAYAFRRLAPGADFALVKEVFNRWGAIRGDSRSRYIVINLAIDLGHIEVARALLDGYEIGADDRATWTEWTGGSSIRYFKAKLRLDGPQVRRSAYENFVDSLAAGRESITSVLLEHAEIFTTIAEGPDWAGMWEMLAEQLATTREYLLGEEFIVDEQSRFDDEDLIVAVYAWALSLPLAELHRHAIYGAIRLREIGCGSQVFGRLARRLIAGKDEEIAEGIQLLLMDESDREAFELAQEVQSLIDHPDYAVAETASVLARRWGLSTSRAVEAMPTFYSLIMDGGDSFDRPELVDSDSGAMIVEDPLGWTYAFEDQIELLAESGVSTEHIRLRIGMLIEKWGGLSAFGRVESKRLESELRRLDMKMTYSRPHIVAAARALRHVAGELRRAGAVPDAATSVLLHMMGYPASRPSLVLPLSRPEFIKRPVLDEKNWNTAAECWLNDAELDASSLVTEADTVIVEVCEFHIQSSRRKYSMRRFRAPGFELDDDEADLDGFSLLPGAFWLGDVHAKSQNPASTVARSLLVSWIPEVPRNRLIICPHWLKILRWHPHVSNSSVFLDNDGTIVARVVWWRDGGPVSIDEDVIWGQGMYLILTPAGRRQLEAQMGNIDVSVYVRRSYTSGYGDESEKFRLVASRDVPKS